TYEGPEGRTGRAGTRRTGRHHSGTARSRHTCSGRPVSSLGPASGRYPARTGSYRPVLDFGTRRTEGRYQGPWNDSYRYLTGASVSTGRYGTTNGMKPSTRDGSWITRARITQDERLHDQIA